MDVVHHNARAFNRHPEPLLLLERALGIFVAALPMLAHGGARKLIILGVPLICFLLVDHCRIVISGRVASSSRSRRSSSDSRSSEIFCNAAERRAFQI